RGIARNIDLLEEGDHCTQLIRGLSRCWTTTALVKTWTLQSSSIYPQFYCCSLHLQPDRSLQKSELSCTTNDMHCIYPLGPIAVG
ncbi:hypothetical protein GBAR_LOCUS27509, partial [Geodia barretti]